MGKISKTDGTCRPLCHCCTYMNTIKCTRVRYTNKDCWINIPTFNLFIIIFILKDFNIFCGKEVTRFYNETDYLVNYSQLFDTFAATKSLVKNLVYKEVL